MEDKKDKKDSKTNGKANGTSLVFAKEETIILTDEERKEVKGGITQLIIKTVAPKEGSTSPVTHYIQPVVNTQEIGEVTIPRSYQLMLRVRPPQVQDETDKSKWSNDPHFPAKLAENETCNAIGKVVGKHLMAPLVEPAKEA